MTNVLGIIGEYNPFHNGHATQIDALHKIGYECVVCVMSGNFVQRGDVSIIDKWSKAEMAIKNGIDLVIDAQYHSKYFKNTKVIIIWI